MRLTKVFIKQIVLLMAVAAALVLVVMYSSKVGSALSQCISIIMPFLIGGAIAFVLNIPMSAIERNLLSSWDDRKRLRKLKRPTSIVLTLIILMAVIALFIVIVIPNLSTTIMQIVKEVPSALEDLSTFLYKLNVPGIDKDANIFENISKNFGSIMDRIVAFAKTGASKFLGSTVTIISGVISKVVNGIIAFVFSIYVLAQKETLGRHIMKLMNAYVPQKHIDGFTKVCNLLNKNFHGFITGQCMDALILGTLFVIVLFICRVPYALMIGVIIAFTALIPVVGAFIGLAIGCILILIINPVAVIRFIIVFIVLQQLEGKLIYPRIVGNSVSLPAIWVLVAIAVGGSMFGVIGMLVFIPILATAYNLLREDVNKRIFDRKTT